MAAEHIEKVLEEVGLSPDQIKALRELNEETGKDFKADTYATPVVTGFKTKFLNDPEFLGAIPEEKIPAGIKQKIEAGQYGRFMNEAKDHFAKLGIDFTQLAEADAKSIKKVVEHVTSHLSKGDAKEVQAQLKAALQEKDKLQQDFQTKIQQETKQAEAKYLPSVKRLITVSELTGVEGLKISAGLAVTIAQELVEKKYSIVLNKDGDGFDVKQKANPELDAIDKAGKTITYKDALLEVLTENDMIDKEDDKPDPEKVKVKVGAGGETVKALPSYIQDKIKQVKPA